MDTSDVNKAASVKAKATIPKAKAKATNPKPRPQPHVAAALALPDNAQRIHQHLQSSQLKYSQPL